MKHTKCNLKLSVAILFLILSFSAKLPDVNAQNNPNTITFDNQSGRYAIVKLIGPTGQTAEVSSGQSRTVNAAAGEYYILTRYGSKPDEYIYAKGDPFTVTQTETQYSTISITLHKVIGGNYPTHPISGEEFNKSTVSAQRIKVPNLKDNTTKQRSINAEGESDMILIPKGKYVDLYGKNLAELLLIIRLYYGCEDTEFKIDSGGKRTVKIPTEYKVDYGWEKTVKIPSPFYIDRYEVTNSKYKLFINATEHTSPPYWKGTNYPEGKENYPVLVTLSDAKAYARWAGKRLPSFGEWTAANSDFVSKKSPWMGRLDSSEANKYRIFDSSYTPIDFIQEVGLCPCDKSPWGGYDLIGNALEWTTTSITVEGKTDVEGLVTKLEYIRLSSYCVENLGYPIGRRVEITYAYPCPNTLLGFRCVKDISSSEGK